MTYEPELADAALKKSDKLNPQILAPLSQIVALFFVFLRFMISIN